MRSKILLIIGLFLFLSSFAHAQVIPFPNGSFETGVNGTTFYNDFNKNWIFSTVGNECLQFGATTGNFTNAQISSLSHSDGFYSGLITAGGSAGVECGVLKNTDLNIFNGKINFFFDYNIPTSGIILNVLFDGNAGNLSQPFCQVDSTVTGSATVACQTPSTKLINDYNVSWSVRNSAGGVRSVYLDNFRYEVVPTLQLTVQEENDPFPIDTNFSLTNELALDTNGMEVIDATCTLNWNGSNFLMSYNSSIGKYEYTTIQTAPGEIFYGVGCSRSGYTADQNVNGSVDFTVDLSTGGKLTVVDIENVSHTISSSKVNFSPSNESNQVIFSIQNNYTSSLVIPQFIYNSLIDGKQYFIYTATQAQYDSNNWVFNDTLTFGLSQDNPIQKIFNESSDQYEYSYDDTLSVGQKKFYKIVYRNPYANYQTIGNSAEWYNVLAPLVFDGNSIDIDVYQTSQFSNIRSIYIPSIPNIFGDENSAFEFQFTAWSDSNGVILNAGQTVFDSDSSSSITLTNEPHRYSFTINGTNFDSQILLKSSSTSPKTIYIYDYTIVPRGYFTKRLELFKQNGDFLDLFLLNGESKKYLQEGASFNAKTTAYDREGDLTRLKVEAFFDTVGDDINKVSYFIEDLSTGIESLFIFNQTVNGIIDLNGNATTPTNPRDLIVRATLINSSGDEISEQSQSLKFVQFPYFGGDFSINFFPTEKRKGKKPSGVLSIRTANLSTLEGFDIRIYDINSSILSPDYQDRIYRGSDFTCLDSICDIQLTINDFLYEDANVAHFVVTALLNTENFSLNNPLIQVDRIINLSQISFDTAKIHQQIERLDNSYRNDEEIPLVLILKSTEADSMRDSLEVYLTLQNCDASSGGNCVNQTTRYNPTGYLFDDKYNYNYYFFRHFYILDNGNALPDGNFISFRATVQDKSGVVQTLTPVLANKCKNNDVGSAFWAGALLSFLNSVIFGDGCNTVQENIVTTAINSDQEIRIDVNSTRVTTNPSQELFMCINLDTNNVIKEPLEANLVCAVWYEVAESPIDNFRVRLTNNFSDLSKTGVGKQYVEFNLPYEVIAYNDLPVLRAELEATSNSSINTVGEFFFESFRLLARDSFFTGKLNSLDSFVNGSGVITNIGADLNLNQAFSPTTIGGVVFYKVNGFPIVNANEYRNNSNFNQNYGGLDKRQFIDFLIANNINYPNKGASVDVFVSDFTSPISLTDPNGILIIDEEASKQQVNQQNTDQNFSPQYNFIPAILTLNVSNTMFWNNFSENETLSLIIKLTLNIKDNFFNSAIDLIDDLANDTVGTIGDLLLRNIIWVAIIIGLLLAVVLVARNWPSENGRTN